MRIMSRLFVVISIVSLVACGGGGGSDSSSNLSTSSMDGYWEGYVSGVDQYSATGGYADLSISNGVVHDFYVVEDLYIDSATLNKINEFDGNAYEVGDMAIGFYFDDIENNMAVINSSQSFGVLQKETIPQAELSQDQINGSWSGKYYSEYRDSIYEYNVTANCIEGICSLIRSDNLLIEANYVEEFKSDFRPDINAWYGRGSGDFTWATSVMSDDSKFMATTMCVYSSTLSGETFFDICDIAVMSRTE